MSLSEDRLKMRPKIDPARWPLEATAFLAQTTLNVDVPEFVPGQTYQAPPQEPGSITGKMPMELI